MEMTAEELGEISAGYQDRFGDTFSNERIASLPQVVDILESWPGAVAFVELKRASIKHFGEDVMLDSVLHELEPVLDRCVLISYHQEILRRARKKSSQSIGWVFDEWNEESRQQAYQLEPDFLITDASQIPAEKAALWPGNWRWVIFEVNDPELALDWPLRGVEFIETNSVQAFAEHEAFSDQFKAQ
jgi:glycerophosphoryl diester phosphodiesterase